MSYTKYKRGYFMPPSQSLKWCQKEYIQSAPIWCSVDLRDGNQALIAPMNLEEKLSFFKLLVKIGFKEIEVGFPAASNTEYEFLRVLIQKNIIPDDVSVQVLTQAREHIIKKTFEGLRGCKNAIVHFYNSTSYAQREQVFKKSKQEVKQIAMRGAKILKECASKTEGNFRFEYSPESFSGTEIDYALDVCNSVIDIFEPTPQNPLIINLPATVEMSLPHIYASQVEYISENIKNRDSVIISLHTHNDRGCAVASTELGLLAGADRVEGTLFGNGERTGNVDIITLALNLHTHGIDSKLDFSDIPSICALYEKVTKMQVYERQPYSGKLVFAAFSGSHQDAISKGMAYHKEYALDTWSVPYLPIDPKDVGREYESDVIRINSQSGKGGIAYVLYNNYGVDLPLLFKEHFSYYVKNISDILHKELTPAEICDIFEHDFVNLIRPLEIIDFTFQKNNERMSVFLKVLYNDEIIETSCSGNGRLDSIANALRDFLGFSFDIIEYSEHSLSQGSTSKAISYVQIKSNEMTYFGAGIDTDIIKASVFGLLSAINHLLRQNINKSN